LSETFYTLNGGRFRPQIVNYELNLANLILKLEHVHCESVTEEKRRQKSDRGGRGKMHGGGHRTQEQVQSIGVKVCERAKEA
jgi:hypothetical protein